MFKYDYSMLKNVNGRTRILSLLVAMVVILLFGFAPAAARQLVDIRVGEYDGFTRIVFELDAPTDRPHFEPQASGKLLVSFDQTQAKLVRKIPVERSRHVNGIQIWQRDGKLSTIIIFDYPNIRLETFPLTNPPRIAVDVFPMPPSKTIVDTPSPAIETPALPTHEIPGTDTKAATVEPLIEKDDTDQKEIGDTQWSQDQDIVDQDAGINKPDAPATSDPATPKMPKLRVSEPKPPISPSPKPDSKNAPVRLQFFLVIGLVIITIGILFLLLLMLLARHKLSDSQKKMSTGDFLREQDQKIEALDSRIKEQFKRYDEA